VRIANQDAISSYELSRGDKQRIPMIRLTKSRLKYWYAPSAGSAGPERMLFLAKEDRLHE
jgi:hypothetical protein